MTSDYAPQALWLDLRLSLGLFTRAPVMPAGTVSRDDLTRSLRLAPVAGVLVGLLCAGAHTLAAAAGVAPLVAAFLAIGAGMIATGALHEDGLADMADGLGGGRDRADKLAIMRDSRIGTYGVLALVLSVGLRAACLASIPAATNALVALTLAHSLSRATLPVAMYLLPLARDDGFAARVGRSGGREALVALLLAAGLALALVGPWTASAVLIGIGLAAALVMALAARHIGGYTGDVLGAVQQATEATVLVIFLTQL